LVPVAEAAATHAVALRKTSILTPLVHFAI